MRCTSYVRVSSDSNDQANSFFNQTSFFQREFELRGHEYIKIYADKGLTGTQLYNRENFNNLMYDCGLDLYDKPIDPNDKRKNKRIQTFVISDRQSIWDRIYVTNTSRWARNTLNFDIIQKLRQKGVGIFFIQQNIDTLDVSQDMLLKIIQIMDENESKDKSKKVKAGQIEGANKGILHSNRKLFGLKYHPRDLNNNIPAFFERISNECKIIRFICYKYDQGYGFRRIIKLCQKKEYKTREGKDFVKSTIRAIIDNSIYCGLDHRNIYDTGEIGNKNTYPKKRENFQLKPNNKIPRVYHPNLYYRNQQRLKSKINHQKQKGIYIGTSDYAGILKCKKCNNVYHKNIDKGREFYVCSGKRKNGLNYCNSPNISKKIIDEYFDNLAKESFVEHYKRLIDFRKKGLEIKLFELINQLDNDNSNKIDKLREELKILDVKYNNLTELYMSGLQDKKKIIEMMKNIETNKFEINEQINILCQGNKPILNKIKEQFELIDKVNKIELKSKYTREEIINMRFNFIYVQSDGKLTNSFHLPFEKNSEIKDKLSYSKNSIKKLTDEVKKQLMIKYKLIADQQENDHLGIVT